MDKEQNKKADYQSGQNSITPLGSAIKWIVNGVIKTPDEIREIYINGRNI